MKHVDPTLVKSFVSGVATGLIGFIIAVIGPLSGAHALSVQTPHDCDDNAVIRCGADTTTEMHHKYNQSPSAQAIYSNFGISDWNMANLTNNAVAGTVTKGGRVMVDGNEVATDAMTAGRQNISGSTAVTSGGTTFYKRTPSVSFQQSSLPAFVVLNSNGEFKYAIIASCGNPVTATPKSVPEKPKPVAPPAQPQPTPPAPQPTPPAPAPVATPAVTNTNINNNTVNVQQQQQQQTPPTPTPAPAPPQTQTQAQTQPPQTQVQTQFVPTPASVVTPVATPVATQPVSLPKTGMSDALYITVLSSIAGMTAHLLLSRRKAKQLEL